MVENWQLIDRASLALKYGVCHIWRLPLLKNYYNTCYAVLSSDERQRAQRFRFEQDQNRSVIARGGLRYLLASYLSVSTDELEFAYSPCQKPYLIGQSISFNVSHAGDWIVYIVSSDHAVGIDIEYQRPLACLALAKRFFASVEYQYLSRLPLADVESVFFHIWVQKEAFVKAVGSGLQYGLDQFSVSGLLQGGLLTRHLQKQWQVNVFPMPGQYKAAYAIECAQHDAYFYELDCLL